MSADKDPWVLCGFGMGNRVAAMANGLSRHRRIRFYWERNPQMRLDWRVVFPNGVEGVDFVDGKNAMEPTRWDGVPCYHWKAAGDQGAALAAYRRIMGSMAGRTREVPAAGVHARIFGHGGPRDDGQWREFLAEVRRWAAGKGMIYLMADSRRDEIAEAAGGNVHFPECREMDGDMDRQRDGSLLYLGDWKSMAAGCKRILSLSTGHPSSAIFPAVAAGADVRFFPRGTGLPRW